MIAPSFCFLATLGIALLPLAAPALEIRSYITSRHDRFVDGTSNLEHSTTAYYGAENYSGVGYSTNPDAGQYTLVTPQHILFANHYFPVLGNGFPVKFLTPGGQVLDRTFSSTIQVPNGSGGTSDLIIVKLNAPIDEGTGIIPFPYLNLANEASYVGTVLTTFGKDYRAGSGTIAAFSNYNNGNIQRTRSFNFNYNNTFGGNDDAYAEIGDSGSPSFATFNGKPALVGVHLAVISTLAATTNYDTFVPQYASTVNGLLSPEGYQLIPADPKEVTLTAATTHAPLLQAFPGSIDFALSNSDPDTATNIRMELTFPSEAIPTGLSAPGWIIENPSPGTYLLRTATFAGNTSSTLTASYSSIPVVTEISINVQYRSDGSPELSQNFDLPVQATFAGFVSGLPLQGESDDPDFDGFPNLIEYAFGGDPGVNSILGDGGQPLSPKAVLGNGSVTYCFPWRTDAVGRGLAYEIEFSETLEEMSWGTAPPAGFNLDAAPYDPDIPGFENVTATLPAGSPDKIFLRAKVTLTE